MVAERMPKSRSRSAEPLAGEPGRSESAHGASGSAVEPLEQAAVAAGGSRVRRTRPGSRPAAGCASETLALVLGRRSGPATAARASRASGRRRGRRPRRGVPRCRRRGLPAAWPVRPVPARPGARAATGPGLRRRRRRAGRSRRCRYGATVSPGARRRIRMTTARSSMVSGMAPMPASAAMAKVGMRSTGAVVGVPADGGPVALVAGVEQAAQVFVGVGVLRRRRWCRPRRPAASAGRRSPMDR